MMTFLRSSLLLASLLTLSGCVIAIDTDRGDEKTQDKTASTRIVTIGEKSEAELLQALSLARAKLAADVNMPDANRQRVLETLDKEIARLSKSQK
jgi:hypothetical protein